MDETLEIVFKWLQILAIVGGLLGAGTIFSHRVNRNYDKRFEEEKEAREKAARDAEKREEARIESELLIHEGICATGHLAEATAIALKEGKTNGKTDKALEYYRKYRDKEDAFRLRLATEKLHEVS